MMSWSNFPDGKGPSNKLRCTVAQHCQVILGTTVSTRGSTSLFRAYPCEVITVIDVQYFAVECDVTANVQVLPVPGISLVVLR